MRDIMLDLETMGSGPNAAIVAIGAVEFDLETGELGPHYYQTVDLESAVAMGGIIDGDTVMWWLKQSPEARDALHPNRVHIANALHAFQRFVTETFGQNKGPGCVWGNGAAFDNVILASAYKRVGITTPWPFWNDRCYRTVKAMNPEVPFVRIGTHHNAVMDAVSQAAHLIHIVRGRPPVVEMPPEPLADAPAPEADKG